jgi:hypothetical protein
VIGPYQYSYYTCKINRDAVIFLLCFLIITTLHSRTARSQSREAPPCVSSWAIGRRGWSPASWLAC